MTKIQSLRQAEQSTQTLAYPANPVAVRRLFEFAHYVIIVIWVAGWVSDILRHGVSGNVAVLKESLEGAGGGLGDDWLSEWWLFGLGLGLGLLGVNLGLLSQGSL